MSSTTAYDAGGRAAQAPSSVLMFALDSADRLLGHAGLVPITT